MRRAEFLKSGALLAAVALFMRAVGLFFNAYITEKLGAEGMGLLSLTMSVYGFAVTFATSGVSLAVTRLCAEALGRAEGKRAGRVLRAATVYALVFGITAAVALYFGSDFVARVWLKDIRTRSSLRLLAVSLPPIALSGVYAGYFTAVRRVVHNALTQVFEQTLRILFTVGGFLFLLPRGVEYACLAFVGSSAAAEFCSFFFLAAQALWDRKRHPLSGGETGGEGKNVVATALPCAVSAYARSGLVTVEHLLIPLCLGAAGLDRKTALSSYAALHSMAVPVVLFPTALLASFSGLLVPECAERQGRGDGAGLCRLTKTALDGAFLFSVGAALLLFLGAPDLGRLLYGNADCGRYIRLLSPLVPVMYMDSVVDAHLKGLGYQVYSMGVNIADAATSVAAVALLLPRFGADGYIAVIYLTEILNFLLSYAKLRALVPLAGRMRRLVPPLLCAVLAGILTAFTARASFSPGALVTRLCCAAAIYLLSWAFFSSALREKTAPVPEKSRIFSQTGAKNGAKIAKNLDGKMIL